MLIKRAGDIAPSEITSEALYLKRREFLAGALAVGATAGIAALGVSMPRSAVAGVKLTNLRKSALSTTGEELTPFKDVTTYNNYYEFGTGKEDPGENSGKLRPRPWTVSIEGEVKKPRVIDIEALIKLAPLEERAYRMRSVEGWSMVIPYVG